MQVFEFHFNPKLREEQIFDSFVYEPENVYERKLGSLYMVGELKNTLPQNLKFLDNLAIIIKKNYYTLSLKSPEKALSECLKKVNEYLGEKVKKDNVSWLGNLNFAILSLNPSPLAKGDRVKDFNLFFTKTGDLKILLIRGGQINDIGKSLDAQEIDPYPLKVFLNIVSGKLTKGDIILILTKEIFSFFQEQNILTKFALSEEINSKKIKEILPSPLFTKGEGSKVSGICLLLFFLQPESPEKFSKIFYIKKGFSLSQIFPNLSRTLRIPRNLLRLAKTLLKPRYQPATKKKLILVLILIFILLLGFLLFKDY